MFSEKKLAEIRQREIEKQAQEYYSKAKKLVRHNEMLKSDIENAKKKKDPKIMWSSCNNDWS